VYTTVVFNLLWLGAHLNKENKLAKAFVLKKTEKNALFCKLQQKSPLFPKE
jgi:hypothetical protein